MQYLVVSLYLRGNNHIIQCWRRSIMPYCMTQSPLVNSLWQRDTIWHQSWSTSVQVMAWHWKSADLLLAPTNTDLVSVGSPRNKRQWHLKQNDTFSIQQNVFQNSIYMTFCSDLHALMIRDNNPDSKVHVANMGPTGRRWAPWTLLSGNNAALYLLHWNTDK